MKLIQIDPSDRRQLRRFIQIPYNLYRGNAFWVPPIKASLTKLLRKGSGMQLAGGPFALFLVEHEGLDIGRILTGVNRIKNQQRNQNEGYFSLFECIEDMDAARTLMDGAMAWLSGQKAERVTGPVSPTNGDDLRGILVEGLDRMPAVNTTYTMPYYPKLMTDMGFAKYLDFHALKLVFDPKEVARVQRIVDYGRKKIRVDVRPLDLSRIDKEVRAVHQVMTAAMLAHWEHLEIPTEEQIRDEFNSMKTLIEPDLIILARIDGEPVGFVAGIPDYNQVLCHLNGRLTPLSLVKYLYYKKKITRVRMFMQFVLPKYQNSFVTPALYLKLFEGFKKHGFTDMEGSTIAEFNLASLAAIKGVGFEADRVYRTYQQSCPRESD